MVSLGLEENITQIVIFVGAFLGNFIATAPPYWRTQEFFKKFDIKIVFDPKFLGTAMVTAITSIVIVSAGFSQIVESVDSEATIIMAFISAGSLGWALNKTVNKFMPSVNTEQNEQVAKKIEEEIIEDYENNKIVNNFRSSQRNPNKNIHIKLNGKSYKLVNGDVETDMTEDEILQQEQELGVSLPRPQQ